MTTTSRHIPSLMKHLRFGNESEERQNRFTGETYLLTPEEHAIFDMIMLAEYMASKYQDPHCTEAQYLYDYVRQGCDYFRRYNAKAYMVLLD